MHGERENSSVQFVDIRDLLIQRKDDGLLYFKTDTHWNELGSFVGYTALLEYINTIYADISPIPQEDFL